MSSDPIKYEIHPATLKDLEMRFTYHAPTPNQQARYVAIRAEIHALARFICERAPQSRELSTALTHLTQVMMLTNAAIACNEAR